MRATDADPRRNAGQQDISIKPSQGSRDSTPATVEVSPIGAVAGRRNRTSSFWNHRRGERKPLSAEVTERTGAREAIAAGVGSCVGREADPTGGAKTILPIAFSGVESPAHAIGVSEAPVD